MIVRESEASLPTSFGVFKILIYKDIKNNLEHAVLVKGEIKKDSCLLRIHSQCLTGDVFSSLKCDCREQLLMSLKKIAKSGGVIIYLNQEGRGIGLSNKIKAYSLQDQGLDTVEANKKLGFEADIRSYKVAVDILKDLTIKSVLLLTNNPDKKKQLEGFGIKVNECISLEAKPNEINKNYLKIKKTKMGHKLNLV